MGVFLVMWVYNWSLVALLAVSPRSQQRPKRAMEAQVDHTKRLVMAQQAWGPEARADVGVDCHGGEVVATAGQALVSGASERSARDIFKRHLILACRCLKEHYRRR